MCGGYCNKHIVKNPMTNEKRRQPSVTSLSRIALRNSTQRGSASIFFNSGFFFRSCSKPAARALFT